MQQIKKNQRGNELCCSYYSICSPVGSVPLRLLSDITKKPTNIVQENAGRIERHSPNKKAK